MNQTQYRLIFKGLDENARVRNLILFLQKEMGMSEKKIRNLLTRPPCVLLNNSSHHNAVVIHDSLKKMGCESYLEPVVSYPSIPFTVSKTDDRSVKKEMSKILRTRTNLVILLYHVECENCGEMPPSMMGPVQDKLAANFRDSDTVLGIDDNRLLFLAFSTDSKGVEYVRKKIDRSLVNILGNNVAMSSGYSLFPEEGRTLAELLLFAERRRCGEDLPDKADIGAGAELEPEKTRSPEGKDSSNSLETCFAKARGKIFKRLLEMEPQTLWIGLSRIPQAGQEDFLARFPYDSQLAPVLEKMIHSPPEAVHDKTDESHFEAIIHQMEFEEGIEARREKNEEITTGLSRVEDLPTLPSIASEVFRIASTPDSSVSELSDVIMNDPALTSKLLKTVNSAFYGSMQKIGTVRQAVVLLGMEEIMDISFGLAAAKVFDIEPVDGLIDPKDLWHHSICTAIIARELCSDMTEYRNVGVFTGGLLHDFGKIYLMESFPDIYRQTHLDSEHHNLPVYQMEEDKFGLNHAMIGKQLSSNWNLPDPLVDAISFHHQPFSGCSHPQLAAIIGLADQIYYDAMTLEDTAGKARTSMRLSYGHRTYLKRIFKGFDENYLQNLTKHARDVIQNSGDLLSILD